MPLHVERVTAGRTAAEIATALRGAPGLAWLDAAAPSMGAGRYSFVTAFPVEVRRIAYGEGDPMAGFDGLDDRREEDAAAGPPSSRLPRWIGYVAYDAAWSGPTRAGARATRDPGATVLWLGRYEALFAFDHGKSEGWLLGDDSEACRRLAAFVQEGAAGDASARIGEPVVEGRAEHEAVIEQALVHIGAGDIYQVNLARRWVASFAGDPLALWLQMRRASPVPLGLFIDAGDHTVMACTMETFIRWERASGRLESRPIKGTIARVGDDEEAARALRSDDKERAEHVMIVDLMRNDLGRVARTGSVRVEELMAVEPYAGLSHLVSTVACETREDVTLRDVLEATFPPGSVTGAPKIRATQIIEALERWPRGVYTGCVGHVDRAGGVHFAVAIRTAEVTAGRVTYFAGGGLVSASVPAREVAETELKAGVFLDAAAALRQT